MFQDFANWLDGFMGKRYVIQLPETEHRLLAEMAHNAALGPQVQTRVMILLAAHSGQSDQQIATQLRISVATAQRTRRRYVTRGLEAALGVAIADRAVSTSPPPSPPERGWVAKVLEQSRQIEGAMGVAVVDHARAVCLLEGDRESEWAAEAVANVELVRAKLATMSNLCLTDELEDILITLSSQYHLIRVLAADPRCFLYLALDRRSGNLAMARHQLRTIELGLAG